MSETSSGPAPEILTDAGPVVPGATVLPAGDRLPHRPAGPGRRALVIGGAVLGTVLVCGAGLAVGQALSGGGTQPEDVLPAGAVAFADVDLDPAAGQKVNAVRFLRSFPQLEQAGNPDDLRTTLVTVLFGDSDVDVATQIDPWLGDRAGVALVREGDDLQLVAAVQTTDTQQAQRSLRDLLAGDGGNRTGFAVSGDYVVIASSSSQAQAAVSAGEQRPLSADPAFTGALDGFGDGVASFYVNGAAAQGVTSVEGAPVPAGQLARLTSAGTAAGIVRFDPDAVELLASASGDSVAPLAQAPTSLIGSLPATTMFALGSAGGGAALDERLDQLLQQVDDVTGMDTAAMVRRQYGLRLPGDLVTLLGTERELAVDGGSADAMAMPEIGYRATTDRADAADLLRRLDPLVRQVTGGLGLVTRTTADGLVVATTPRYAAALTAGDGDLGAAPGFRDAVPDAGGAAVVGYLDLDRLTALLRALSPDSDPSAIDPLRAVGLSVTVADGSAQYRVRVTLD